MYRAILKSSLLLLLPVIVTLSSCTGGGEGGTGVAPNDSDNVLASGEIQSLDSVSTVRVNGINFDTQSSSLTRDGNPVTNADLEAGMVVLVTGKKRSSTSATASQLQVVDTIKGPLDGSPSQNSFDILGQTILYDQNTVFKNVTRSDFRELNSDELEIGGFIKESGIIVATYIEKKDALSEYQVVGFVNNLNDSSFKLGGLKVNFGNAQQVGFPNDTLSNNHLVLVKGAAEDFHNDDEMILDASKVKLETLEINEIPVADIDHIEIEGYVAIDLTNNEFYLNNLKVQVNASTRYERGTAIDLKKGTKIEVEGYLASGIIVANEISFEEGIELRGNIRSVSENGNISLQYIDTGVTIVTDNNTQLNDFNNIDDLVPGNHVRVRGRDLNNNRLLANTISLIQTTPSNRLVVQSHYRSFDATNQELDLSGFIIRTSDISATALEGPLDTFLTNLKTGELVHCSGTVDLNTGIIIWSKIEKND